VPGAVAPEPAGRSVSTGTPVKSGVILPNGCWRMFCQTEGCPASVEGERPGLMALAESAYVYSTWGMDAQGRDACPEHNTDHQQ
jgi:hypothetical protein